MSAHLRVGSFRALKMRPVRHEAVHSLWSRLFCGPLKMRRVPQEGVFVHRISFLYRKSLFLRTECLRKRIAYHRRLFCAPSVNSVPEMPVFYTECLLRAEKCQFSQKDQLWVRGVFLNEKPLTDHSVRGFKCSLRDSNPRHPD